MVAAIENIWNQMAPEYVAVWLVFKQTTNVFPEEFSPVDNIFCVLPICDHHLFPPHHHLYKGKNQIRYLTGFTPLNKYM